jgi:hypothetical protein
VPPPAVLRLSAVGRAGCPCDVLRLMAQDDDRQVVEAAEFRQKLEAMVVAADEAKKKAAAACTRVLTAAALLE